MARFEGPNHARFLTYSCFNRLPLFADPLVRDLYVSEIAAQSERLGFDVIAYVVMPEHVHLVVVPDDGRINRVMRGLKQGFARRMLARMTERDDPMLYELIGTTGKAVFWQRGGGYERTIRSEDDLREKIGYIHANPVKRGLVGRPEDWEWSSARDYSGGRGVVRLRRGW